MHIMIVIHSLRSGGAERVTADLSSYWHRLGYKVSVVTQLEPDTDVYPLAQGVQRHVLHTAYDTGGGLRGLWANWRRARRLRALIKKHRPDCVLGMMTTSSVLSVMASRGLKNRVIAMEHTHPPKQKLPDAWQKMRHWAYQRTDAVVTLTSATAQWVRQHIPGTQVHVIPNAVRWPLPAMEPQVDSHKTPGRYRLLAVGRYHEVKGFDRLIEAFGMLAKYFPDWDLAIVGDGAQREALSEQIDALGLQERVQLVGQVGNIQDWYESADIYVLSSRYEGLSNSLLEAMACGLPVVAVDCDVGPREIIRNDIDGVLVSPADDIEALAAHLSDLMGRPLHRTALARRAVDVRDRFSVARIMTLWEAVLRAEQDPLQAPQPKASVRDERSRVESTDDHEPHRHEGSAHETGPTADASVNTDHGFPAAGTNNAENSGHSRPSHHKQEEA